MSPKQILEKALVKIKDEHQIKIDRVYVQWDKEQIGGGISELEAHVSLKFKPEET